MVGLPCLESILCWVFGAKYQMEQGSYQSTKESHPCPEGGPAHRGGGGSSSTEQEGRGGRGVHQILQPYPKRKGRHLIYHSGLMNPCSS